MYALITLPARAGTGSPHGSTVCTYNPIDSVIAFWFRLAPGAVTPRSYGIMQAQKKRLCAESLNCQGTRRASVNRSRLRLGGSRAAVAVFCLTVAT